MSRKIKKVLIPGGMGFIGSNLVRKYHEAGAKVTIFDCLDPHSGGKLYNICDIKSDLNVIHSDILNFDQISQAVIDQDLIINCAASTSHPFSMREPWIDLDINSRGMINILEAIRRFNPTVKFIHLGTSTQLGRLHYQPANESHPEFPMDIYSANKSVSEKYVLIYAHAYNLRASVLRLSNVFGPRAAIHSPEFTFNNYFIGLALQDRPITIFGDGAQKRNVLFINDVINALGLAAECDAIDGDVFFLVGDKHYKVAEVAEETAKHLGSGKVDFIEWPSDRKRTEFGHAILSNEKLKKMIDWKPENDLKEGLIITKEFYKDRLEHYLA